MSARLKYLTTLLGLVQLATAQIDTLYIAAGPDNLITLEQSQFANGAGYQNLDFRPFINQWPERGVDIQVYGQSQFYYNDNAPNLENTSELWVGKGATVFNSIHLNISHRNFFFSIEPYYQYAENQPFVSYDNSQEFPILRDYVRKFQVLNHGPGRGEDPVNELRLRETQLYIHKNGLGAGVSNSGMWWGPGIHTTLNMTTNTTGIPRVVLGTLKEQRFRNFGLMSQYVFAKMDKNVAEPYFTAVFGSLTYYSNPVVTLGGSRTFLSGGKLVDEPISWKDAAMQPFQPILKEQLYNEETGENPSDQTDQTLSFFVSMLFPESRLKVFLEYGWNDHRWDWYDLRAHPDHSGASIFGLRKYGLFGKPQLFLGFEYANLMKSPYYPHRATPDWYGRKLFDYSVYDGRRYAAHSGSDSDDMILFMGYQTQSSGFTFGFNYERHGKIYSVELLDLSLAGRFPEDKLELRLNYWKNTKYGDVILYYEYEFTENLGSPPQGVFPRVDNPERKANVFGISFKSQIFSF